MLGTVMNGGSKENMLELLLAEFIKLVFRTPVQAFFHCMWLYKESKNHTNEPQVNSY